MKKHICYVFVAFAIDRRRRLPTETRPETLKHYSNSYLHCFIALHSAAGSFIRLKFCKSMQNHENVKKPSKTFEIEYFMKVEQISNLCNLAH